MLRHDMTAALDISQALTLASISLQHKEPNLRSA